MDGSGPTRFAHDTTLRGVVPPPPALALVLTSLLVLAAASTPALAQVDPPLEVLPPGPASRPAPLTESEVRRPPGPQTESQPSSDAPPETLADAWEFALRADRRLQSKQYDLAAAQQTLQSARANRWPLVSVDSYYAVRSADPAFRINFDEPGLGSRTFPYAQSQAPGVAARVDVPLYTHGAVSYGIEAAQSQATASALEWEDAVHDLKLQVAEDYLRVLGSQAEAEAAAATVRSLEGHLLAVQTRHSQRLVPDNDLLAAKVALADAQCQAIRAQNAVDLCRAAYNRRLGRPLGTPVVLQDVVPRWPQGDLEQATAGAIAQNRGLARLAAQVQALRNQSASVAARNGPQVHVRGEYAYEDNRFRSPDGVATATLGVSWNLFDGGRLGGEAAALLERAAAVAALRADLESRVALQVREAWLAMHETGQRLQVTPSALQHAEENLRGVRERYALGMATNNEVLDAELLRTQARRNLITARYGAVAATIRFGHAIGTL